MTDSARATVDGGTDQALAARLVSLVVDSWHELDRCGGRDLAGFFAEDAVFDLGSSRFEGREGIRRAMAARAARGPRTTRHLAGSFRVTEAAGGRVVVTSVLQVYGADGEPPLPVQAPTAIGDIEDTFVRDDAGRWLIESRIFHAVFVDAARFAPFAASGAGSG